MKRILKYISICLLGSGLLVSCDLDTIPTNYVDEESIYDNTTNIESALNGAYKYLNEASSTYQNRGYSGILRACDAMGSDMAINSKYGFKDHYTFVTMNSRTSTATNWAWDLLYTVINVSNHIITKTDAAEGPETDKRILKGEAYGLRGVCYLTLASLYQLPTDNMSKRCAPIYTEPTTSATTGNPKSTVKQVYEQAINDLIEANRLLPDDYERWSKFRLDQDVINGLLARAYLYTKDWANAEIYADKALKFNNGYLMTEDEYNAGFNSVSNDEWMWGFPQGADQSTVSYNFHYLDVTSSVSYYFSFNADPYVKALFDDNDYRKKLINWGVDPNVDPSKLDKTAPPEAWMRFAKYKFRSNPNVGDALLMRVSEMYLIKAEAQAHQSTKTGDAVTTLNILKNAREATPIAGTPAQQDVIDAVLLERRKELFSEGFSLPDIIRNEQAVVRKEYVAGDLGEKVFNENDPVDMSDVPSTDSKFESIKKARKGTIQIKHSSGELLWVKPKGHRSFTFPDKTNYVPNSPYYLFSVPQKEETSNPNLNK